MNVQNYEKNEFKQIKWRKYDNTNFGSPTTNYTILNKKVQINVQSQNNLIKDAKATWGLRNKKIKNKKTQQL